MKRKHLAIVIFLVLATMLSLSCSKQKDDNSPITITIWHDKEDVVVDVIKQALEPLSPDIVVNFERKASLAETLKLVGNNPKTAPDMYLYAHDKIGVYVEMGILEPITNLVNSESIENLVPMTKTAATYKDKIYQLPIYFETLLFLYNKKYMKANEVPSTTDELLSYAKDKTKYGHFGYIEQHSTPYYFGPWINGFGGKVIDEKGNPCLDSEEMLQALAYHLKFVKYMPDETEYATVNTLFSEGKAHTTIGGPWLIPTIKKAGIDVGIAKMPVINQTGKPLTPYLGVQGFQVLKTGVQDPDKKEAIIKILQILSSEEVEIQLALASGCAPAREGCYSYDSIKNDEIVMAMRDTAENAVPMPNIPEMDVMWTVTGNLLTAVNMSGKDIKISANEAQKKAESLIENMK